MITNDIELKKEETKFLSEIFGMIETVTTAPDASTGNKPTKLINQIKFYSSGSTYRLYVYDATNDVWRYVALT